MKPQQFLSANSLRSRLARWQTHVEKSPRIPIGWFHWGWLPVFLLGVTVALLIRPLMPVDETRYLAVAWDMWQNNQWLVPHLNGEPYSHKPPLLFWLIHLGWAIFGVNEITPRLLAPIFALASMFLSRAIARRAWPDQPIVAGLVPWMLVGSLYWLVFSGMVMFDMVVVFFVLLGVHGIQQIAAGNRRGWWWLFLGVACGVLAKGPFALIFLVPLTVLAPWWTSIPLNWRWFLRAGVVGTAASSLGLIWALLAAWTGGSAYAEQILWGQMAGRAVDAFDHGEPIYYYLVVALPLMTLPWFLLPDLLPGRVRRLIRLGRRWPEGLLGEINRRQWWLLVAWVGVPLVLLSLASGKLPHYILPMLPVLALFAAVRLVRVVDLGAVDARPIAAFWLVFALIIGVLHWVGHSRLIHDLAWWTTPLALVVAAGGLLLWVRRPLKDQVPLISLQTLLVLVLVHLSFIPLRPAFDFHAYALDVAKLQQEGRPLAFEGKYRGEYDFYGRLTKPIAVVYGPQQVAGFCSAHPEGVMLMRTKNPSWVGPALFSTRFRSGYDVAVNCPDAVALMHGKTP